MFEKYEVIRNAEMREYTTLKLGGPAEWLAFPRSREEIIGLFAEAGRAGMGTGSLPGPGRCSARWPRPPRRRG